MPEHDAAGGPARLVEIADGVHAYVQPDGGWCLNNAGIITAPGAGAVVVDTAATERRALALRDTVDRLADGPRRIVVNTHFHGDHVFGNAVFGPAATVIAHDGTRAEMIETGTQLTEFWPDVDWGAVSVVPPDVTYTGELTLHVGERRIELLSMGPAHTRHDTVVWLPAERVLFTGDIVMPGCTPFVPMGTVTGSLAALDRMRALRPRVVVGGHGPVSGPEAFDETERYLRWVRRTAAEAAAEGLTPLATVRRAAGGGFGGFGSLLDPERLVGNLRRARLELDGGELARPMNAAEMFGELVEWNGGLPACHA